MGSMCQHIFYKVVHDPVGQDAIAFLVPHRAISKEELPVFHDMLLSTLLGR